MPALSAVEQVAVGIGSNNAAFDRKPAFDALKRMVEAQERAQADNARLNALLFAGAAAFTRKAEECEALRKRVYQLEELAAIEQVHVLVQKGAL